ncbi:MAG: helix-turn-helix domain-containing protein [Pseudonocardiaceae bacterium]
MDERSCAAQELAGLLQTLKNRSNLSYQQLAKKTFTSSSALHRYCSGASAPTEFDTLVRIAQACGASPAEQADLLRYWTVFSSNHHQPAASAEAPPSLKSPSNELNQQPIRFAAPTRTLRRGGMAITAAVVVLIAVPGGRKPSRHRAKRAR